MTKKTRKILITCALPYANGPIHLGHLVEYIQADIWSRFQKMQGHHVLFVCGEDCHGTATMLLAEKENIDTETLVQRTMKDHHNDFKEFYIDFDNFYLTHSEENKVLAEDIFKKLEDRGDIFVESIKQAYDPEKEMFLPDRFVKGECPRCGAKDQYGDSCDSCGSTYAANELKNPVSVVSGATPIEKSSEHLFFKLKNYETFLKTWLEEGRLQPQVKHKLMEWFEAGLRDWNISRDAPYFGFEIPGYPGKYFYVWMDAPMGYMASLKNLCDQRNDLNFDDYWKKDSDAELIHFIGKDIVYFHALFWPAVLHAAGYRTPTHIHVHSMLTINGAKMSKSKGTFIKAKTYLEHFHPEYLRYYYAAKLSDTIEDVDLNFNDFMLRINSDLVGKYINIASRTAGFITKRFDGLLSDTLHKSNVYQVIEDASSDILNHYENRDYSHAVRRIMALADHINQYIAEEKPWDMVKHEHQQTEAQQVCTTALNGFRLLSIYLKPMLPHTVEAVEAFLNINPLTWEDLYSPLLNHRIKPFKPLLSRIEESQIEAIQSSAKVT